MQQQIISSLRHAACCLGCRWGNNAGKKWRGNRNPTASINFVCAHDGFTLADLVAYNDKHNDANGENNKDGESHNLSWNCGAEGPTERVDVNRCATWLLLSFVISALSLLPGALLGGLCSDSSTRQHELRSYR